MPPGVWLALVFLGVWFSWCVIEAIWNAWVDGDYRTLPIHLWHSMTHLSKTWKIRK